MISTANNNTKQLVILSGKGGTGKTSLAAALVHLASCSEFKPVFVDADVDAANLALVTDAQPQETYPFVSSKLAEIDPEKCNLCHKCFEMCRYDAIALPSEENPSYSVIDLLCDGCAACVYSCPESAIEMIEQQDGTWYRSSSSYGPLFHAELFPGAENSGKLVTEIKQNAKRYAEDHHYPLMILDGPPGIGCPVIASSTGVDLAVLVAEPGLSGIHDLQRIIGTLKHFKIPIFIVINKADLYPKGTQDIHSLSISENIQVIGQIPFDSSIPHAMVNGLPISKYAPNVAAALSINVIWLKIKGYLFEQPIK